MSSPFRASSCPPRRSPRWRCAACDREERHSRSKPIGETVPAGESPRHDLARRHTSAAARSARQALRQQCAGDLAGAALFSQMNCVGCHSHGGGGMGPPLMDDEWRYGGRIDQIATTIAEGRPNGMPSWRSKLTEDQIWQLAAYVRSLSGQPSKDAVPQPRRSDEQHRAADADAARAGAHVGHRRAMSCARACGSPDRPARCSALQLPALPEHLRQCRDRSAPVQHPVRRSSSSSARSCTSLVIAFLLAGIVSAPARGRRERRRGRAAPRERSR